MCADAQRTIPEPDEEKLMTLKTPTNKKRAEHLIDLFSIWGTSYITWRSCSAHYIKSLERGHLWMWPWPTTGSRNYLASCTSFHLGYSSLRRGRGIATSVSNWQLCRLELVWQKYLATRQWWSLEFWNLLPPPPPQYTQAAGDPIWATISALLLGACRLWETYKTTAVLLYPDTPKQGMGQKWEHQQSGCYPTSIHYWVDVWHIQGKSGLGIMEPRSYMRKWLVTLQMKLSHAWGLCHHLGLLGAFRALGVSEDTWPSSQMGQLSSRPMGRTGLLLLCSPEENCVLQLHVEKGSSAQWCISMVFALENTPTNAPCYLFIDSCAKANRQAEWCLAVEWLVD